MWTYKKKRVESIEDIPEGVVGFIYEVTHTPSKKKYIGKKQLVYKKTLPPLKGKKRRRHSQKESDWKTYYGSNETIKGMISEGKVGEFKREILQYAYSKKQLSYLETKYLFLRNVLESDEYFNENILGKFFRRDV